MARGHIRRRGDAWEIRVYAGRNPDTGKERRITRTVRGTEKTAERALTRLLGEIDQGAHAGPDATFATLCDRWVEARSPSWSPKTTDEHRGIIRRHLTPTLGPQPIHRVTGADLDRLYARLRADGLSPATVRRVHGVAHSALHQAVRWGWLVSNPAANATPPTVEVPDVAPIPVAEIQRFLAHLVVPVDQGGGGDPELALFLWISALTGARRGEVCALRWSDIDLDHGEVTISRSLVITGGDVIERRTKTGNKRTIAIGPALVYRLRQFRAEWLERDLSHGRGSRPDFLFVRAKQPHLPWRPDSVTRWFNGHRQALGITGRLHDLRHGVATLLVTEGFDPITVAGRLGHANPSTTLKTYGHFQQAPDRAAAMLLEERLGG